MEILKEIEQSLAVSVGEMRAIIKRFQSEMEKGLAGKESSLKMIPTFSEPATGKERGTVIAIDLGGTNFRILKIELKGYGKISKPLLKQFELKKYHINLAQEEFFGLLARYIKTFLKEAKIDTKKEIPVSFIFSFPVRQDAIDIGILIKWTKGFNINGIIGKDVVKLFNKALERNGLKNLEIKALANDTVGALQARRYKNPTCDMGVILGTGTNACYVEEISNIKKWRGESAKSQAMIINMEWGNFDKLKKTRYDIMLDQDSDNAGEQILEKMVSGKYLGEVARLILYDIFEKNKIFAVPYSFDTKKMSGIAIDPKGLNKEKKTIKEVCDLVSTRAARIFAPALIATVTKNDPLLKKRHTVLIDGSVYQKYPGFPDKTRKAIRELLAAKSKKINLATEKDATGIGAAVIAAVAEKSQSKNPS